MNKVKSIEQQTKNRFLNMYDYNAVNRKGKECHYYVASRAEKIEDLKLSKGEIKSDAVIIYGIYDDNGVEKMVLVRQFRYSIDNYVYELPAGLVDGDESECDAAKREFKEETGLDFEPIEASSIFNKPFFTSVGLCDECCTTIYGKATGTINLDGLEDEEDLEVVLADRAMVREILENEIIAMPVGYSMLYFLASENGHALDFVEAK